SAAAPRTQHLYVRHDLPRHEPIPSGAREVKTKCHFHRIQSRDLPWGLVARKSKPVAGRLWPWGRGAAPAQTAGLWRVSTTWAGDLRGGRHRRDGAVAAG